MQRVRCENGGEGSVQTGVHQQQHGTDRDADARNTESRPFELGEHGDLLRENLHHHYVRQFDSIMVNGVAQEVAFCWSLDRLMRVYWGALGVVVFEVVRLRRLLIKPKFLDPFKCRGKIQMGVESFSVTKVTNITFKSFSFHSLSFSWKRRISSKYHSLCF